MQPRWAVVPLAVSWMASFLVLFVTSTTYAADLSGTWSASSLRVSWSIGDWGEACGPRPSGGGDNGGMVTLTQTGGDFKLSGLGRSYSSNQCWEQMPGLSARAHSAGSSAIQTTCKMPSGDPRQATVVTTWSPRGDKLYFDETGQYQFVLKGSNCTASVRRTRVMSRVVEKSEPEPLSPEQTPATKAAPAPPPKASGKKEASSAAPPPPPAQASHCASPGKAVSLEVTPKTKLMRVGETFEFQAIARDANGCRALVDTKWKLISGDGTLSPNGTLTVPESASTGNLTLQASVDDTSVKVAARIVTDEEYEALIAGGEYGVMGESREAASVNLSTAHVEFDAETPAEDSGKKNAILLLFAALLVLVASVAFILIWKSRTKATAPLHTEAPLETKAKEEPAPPLPAPIPAVEQRKPARLCPVCGTRYEDETLFCGEDGARLVRSN